MKYILLLLTPLLLVSACSPELEAEREDSQDALEMVDDNVVGDVWTFFQDQKQILLSRHGGTDYGELSADQYPTFASVKEWDFLTEQLEDGSMCVMVFYHQRWRRLPDVLGLSEELRNYEGCGKVF